MKRRKSNILCEKENEAQYDESAKRLLAQKHVLANILAKTVKEFEGMEPADIVPFIEGEPYVSTILLEPGLTNAEKKDDSMRVVGLNTENAEMYEGLIRFDIVFYVRIPLEEDMYSLDSRKTELTKMIINVEAQKDEPTSYKILNRAIFYVSRLVSSQKERDFAKTNYSDIKKVYSIWVCMNMPENSICHIHLTKDDLLGSREWKGSLDLLNIVMIGLTNEIPEHNNEYEMHRLLCTMFSQNLSQKEKLEIIEQEYDIPMEEKFREDVTIMCNLSQGIKEAGKAEGKTEVILNMHKKGYTIDQIIDIVEMSREDVESVIAEK